MIDKLIQLSGRLLRVTLHNPRDLQHVLGIANWAAGQIADPVADVRSIPHIDVLDICPGTQRWALQSFPSVGASVSPMECAALGPFTKSQRKKNLRIRNLQRSLNDSTGSQRRSRWYGLHS